MLALIKLFFDICRLRTSPADVPASQFLALICVAAYAVSGFAISLLGQRAGNALISIAVDLGMMIGLLYLGLWVRDLRPRLLQSVSALTGTGTIFSLLGLPVILWLQQDPETISTLGSILLLALIVWNIAVIGHILRHALDLPTWAGMGISVVYVYTSLRVMSALFVAGNGAA